MLAWAAARARASGPRWLAASAQAWSDSQRSTSVAPAEQMMAVREWAATSSSGDSVRVARSRLIQSGEGGRRAAGMAEGPSWRQSASPSWPVGPRTRMRSLDIEGSLAVGALVDGCGLRRVFSLEDGSGLLRKILIE